MDSGNEQAVIIQREKIIGYVVTVSPIDGAKKGKYDRAKSLAMYEITADTSGDIGDVALCEDEMVKGIIPAINDYVVYVEDAEGTWHRLGIEYGGLSFKPNWEDLGAIELKKQRAKEMERYL